MYTPVPRKRRGEHGWAGVLADVLGKTVPSDEAVRTECDHGSKGYLFRCIPVFPSCRPVGVTGSMVVAPGLLFVQYLVKGGGETVLSVGSDWILPGGPRWLARHPGAEDVISGIKCQFQKILGIRVFWKLRENKESRVWGCSEIRNSG